MQTAAAILTAHRTILPCGLLPASLALHSLCPTAQTTCQKLTGTEV